jgi:hypothetical protein
MLEEDDSSTINVVSPDTRAYDTSSSSTSANAVTTSESVESSRVNRKATQNSAILQASLEVSIKSKNQPLALLLKSAITGINDLLKPQFGDNAIQAAASQDNTPSGTAGRIVSLSTGFYEAFKQQHPGENANDVLTKFMATIRSGFEQGAKEAQVILTGMGVLSGDIASNIDKTLALVMQGYTDFETAQRASLETAA